VTTASDNIFPKLILDAVTDPSAPSNDNWKLYAKVDGIYARSSNTTTGPFVSATGGGIAATIFDAKGDIIAATAADTAARLAVGANSRILMADSAESTGLRWHELSTVDYQLGGDVTMTNANTYYDGPSGSFAAGTWLIWWKVLVTNSTANTHDYNAKLWNSTTVYDESATQDPTTFGGRPQAISGFTIETFAGTETVKVSVADVRAGGTILRNTVNNTASSNSASRILGVRIA
jgi:hypothetical protein